MRHWGSPTPRRAAGDGTARAPPPGPGRANEEFVEIQDGRTAGEELLLSEEKKEE